MGLPEIIRVKLSSEEAGSISVTPVVVREMPLRELVELMLDITGKDASRIRELLLRGTLVAGASRYRWASWEADLAGLRMLLDSLPSPEPARPFEAERCVRVVLHGPALRREVTRVSLEQRRFLRRRSFWDALVEIAAETGVAYSGYSYRDRADRYRLEISQEASARIIASASLLRYSRLEEHLGKGDLIRIEFLVERPSA